MGRRTLLLIASILVAAVGTALIGLYVRGADDRAQETVGTVTTLIASANIEPNTSLEIALGSMTTAQVPRNLIGDGGFTGAAISDVRTTLKGQVVRTEILANQVIQKQMFDASGASVNTGIKNGAGVAIELTDPARAAGLLVPGSIVTIYETDAEDQATNGAAKVVLPNATVLRIGNQETAAASTDTSTDTSAAAAATPSDNVPRTIVTLDLTEPQAALVIGAQARGALYFAVHGGKS